MKTVTRRLRKLEDQFGTGSGKPQVLYALCGAVRLALDVDECIRILRECGSLPTGPIGKANLTHNYGRPQSGANGEVSAVNGPACP